VRVGIALAGAGLALAGCSSSGRGTEASIGVGTDVTLVTANDATSLLVGQTLAIVATVANESNGPGVTWSVSGVGTLENVTPTTATFVAPATATGAVSAVITVTSIANPADYATATLIVEGTPVISATTLFPANQGIEYFASIAVAGGDAPFDWTILSGSLPPGISIGGSTDLGALSGTPSALGTYTFTAQVTDSDNNVATVPLTLTVNPQAACTLQGQYAFLYSGFKDALPASFAGSMTISTLGTVTGEVDYKDHTGTLTSEPLTGTCQTLAANTGLLKLTVDNVTLQYDYALAPDLSTGRIQLVYDGGNSGAGLFALQDTTAFSASSVTGNYVFGLIGTDGNAAHFGVNGQVTMAGVGALSAGQADSNDPSTPLSAAPVTGTLSAADANGRGTLTLAAGGQSYVLAYYVVSASRLLLMDVDSGATAPYVTGFLTLQSGTFNTASLIPPAILTLWGAQGTTEPISVVELGRLSGGDGIGSVNVMLDTSSHQTATEGISLPGASYTVSPNGRGTLSFIDQGVERQFVLYMDAAADGYVVEQGSASGSAGLLEAQSAGPFGDSYSGQFVSGTPFPQSRGPISLTPALYLNDGELSSTYINGTFAIDTTGHGTGQMAQAGVGTTSASLYVVSPTKIDLLRFGTRAIDGTLEWMTQ
jgi:hypothetical protein